jgi:hypothetical protein
MTQPHDAELAPELDAAPPAMPTWVMAGLVALAVVAVALLVAALAGGDHGPGMHGAHTG